MMKNVVRTNPCDWDINGTHHGFKVAVCVEFGTPGKQSSGFFAFLPHRKTTPLSNCQAKSSLLFSQAVVFALGGSFPVEMITMDQTAEVIM